MNKKTLLNIALTTFCIFILFFNLNQPKIESWDEGTNAQVVRELNESNNFDLTFLDEPFLEKPPLWYYSSLLAVRVFGFNEFALRFVSAVSGLILSVAIFKYTQEKYSYRSAVLSVLTFVTTFHNILQHTYIFSTHNYRSADLDGLFILFFFLSFYAFEKKQNLIGIICVVISVLTKGPLGFLPLVLKLILSFRNKRKEFKSLGLLLISTIIFFGILIGLMYINSGDKFFGEFINYHIINRIFSPIENHSGSIFFYLFLLINPSIFQYFVFLSFLPKVFNKYKLLIFISGLIIIIFTIVQTKLSWYILPVYPFLSIIIGDIVAENKNKVVNIFFGIIFVVSVCIIVFKLFNPILTELPTIINQNEKVYYYTENLNRSDLYYLENNNVVFGNVLTDEMIIRKDEYDRIFYKFENYEIVSNYTEYFVLKYKNRL